VAASRKACEEFADRFVVLGLLDAVLLGKDRGAVFVQQVRQTLGHKQQVAFHQPHRDSRANRG
jgi:hypothetical protein